ncbi:MAG: DUF5666 domain-containing protein [Ottowia sp.]|uniref:DUF5666 domain-containing protein n=1 Tax=Ottowia sp. TaxID=1898956 RepID=UPI003C77BA4C
MNRRAGMRALTAALLLAAAGYMTGCGGGDGVGSGGTGVFKSTVAVGSVTDTASSGYVVINGVRFDVSQALMEIDGAPAGQLKPGMTVQVEGTVDSGLTTGKATRVVSVPELRGTVDAVDEPQGQFSVLGVPVSVDKATIFDGVSGLSTLQPGQSAQVYALPNGSALRATRVEALSAAPGTVLPVLWSKIEALDSLARRFQAGALVVDYGQTAFGEGLSAATLANGAFLYISAQEAPVGKVLKASLLRPAHELPAQANSPVTLAGLVTAFTSAQSFVVQGTPIDASQVKVITGGTIGDVGLGTKLTVAGRMADGVLVAQRVEILQAASDSNSGAKPETGGSPDSGSGNSGNSTGSDNSGNGNPGNGSGSDNSGNGNSGSGSGSDNPGNGNSSSGSGNGNSGNGNSGNGGTNSGSGSGNSGSGSGSDNSSNGNSGSGSSDNGNSGNGGSNNGSSGNEGTNNGGSNNGNSGSGGTNNGGSNNGNSGNGGTNNGGSNNGNSGNGGTNNGGSNNGNSGSADLVT